MNILLRTSRGRGGKGRECDFIRRRERGVEIELVYLRNCIVTLILTLNKFHKLTNRGELQSLIKGCLEKHILYT